MKKSFRNRFRNRSEFVITPEMRVRHRKESRELLVSKIKSGHAAKFPYTYFKDVLGAAGLPLEAVRWLNRNDFKPKSWWKRKKANLRDRWDAFKVSRYKIPTGAYSHGDEAELREFVAGFTKIDGEYGTVYRRKWRRDKYWYTAPGDHIVNKEITDPGTNGSYLRGAVSFRFDDDFFTFVVLPYRYRSIPTEVVMTILFPDVPLEKYEFIPDSDSPELETYMRHNWLKGEAIRMVGDKRKNLKWDDAKASITPDERISVTLLRDDIVLATETTDGATVEAYMEKKRRG